MTKTTENEYKFTNMGEMSAAEVVGRLRSFLDSSGVTFEEKTRKSVDTYYDSDDLVLYRSDCSLRQKVSSNGKIKLTIKRPVSKDGGVMSREEIEIRSDGSLESVKSFCGQYFPDLRIGDIPVVSVENERYAFNYTDGSGIMLSLDSCEYVSGERRTKFYEIEIESMDDGVQRDFDSIGLCGFVKDELGFEPTVKSKYCRGVEWVREGP